VIDSSEAVTHSRTSARVARRPNFVSGERVRKSLAGGAAGLALAMMLLAGCDSGASGTTDRSTGTPDSARAARKPTAPATAPPAAVWARWGLQPLPAAPVPPAVKPVKLGRAGPVPVVSRIPTRNKVVFITIDDGAEKDPEFVRMMRELRVPITMFLTDAAIKSNYGYFTKLQQLGNSIQNHTISHPNLNTLGLAAQHAEICGQEQKLTKEYGKAPYLFRPPYGNYNADTLTAVKECGPKAVVLWKESMQIRDMQYQNADRKLSPGDIILAHFRGPAQLKRHTMTQMFANMLRHIKEQGYAVGRLDDYL
jgi:peptidoglycan/xylan/chitin deacetylase (PgdA/CDA1 family)